MLKIIQCIASIIAHYRLLNSSTSRKFRQYHIIIPNSRTNSASQADYSKLPRNPNMVVPPPNVNANTNGTTTPNGNGGPFKPVPPPKPKNYRPPMQGGAPGQWENGVSNG